MEENLELLEEVTDEQLEALKKEMYEIEKPLEDKEVEELTDDEKKKLQEKFYKQYLKLHTPWTKNRLPRRNDPCPCGSGKKYKNCCGKDIKPNYSAAGENFNL